MSDSEASSSKVKGISKDKGKADKGKEKVKEKVKFSVPSDGADSGRCPSSPEPQEASPTITDIVRNIKCTPAERDALLVHIDMERERAKRDLQSGRRKQVSTACRKPTAYDHVTMDICAKCAHSLCLCVYVYCLRVCLCASTCSHYVNLFA